VRVRDWDYRRFSIVMPQDVDREYAGYSINEFVRVRLIVFPPFPPDDAGKIALDGITLNGLYHLCCAVIFGAPLYVAVR
jgi:hypothetical protein